MAVKRNHAVLEGFGTQTLAKDLTAGRREHGAHILDIISRGAEKVAKGLTTLFASTPKYDAVTGMNSYEFRDVFADTWVNNSGDFDAVLTDIRAAARW